MLDILHKIPHPFNIPMMCLIIWHAQITDFLPYLGFELMKVDENCMRDVSFGLDYQSLSTLLSTLFWLKYHKKLHLPNNLAPGVDI